MHSTRRMWSLKAAALAAAATMAPLALPSSATADESPTEVMLAYYRAGGYEGHKARVGSRAYKRIPREIVEYETSYAPGTVVISTDERRLYLVLEEGKALRYGIGVGREGFQWAGQERITRKAEWPGWTPPPPMRLRQPDLPMHMPGGPANPLGARAFYLGSSWFRIHGSNEPWTIGSAVSSGCIRMTNEDVIDLYERVPVGAKVVVLR